MIVERGANRSVRVRYRNERGERCEDTLNESYPYLFVKDADVGPAENVPGTVVISSEDGYEGVYGESLTRLTFRHPADLRQVSNKCQTWEANIPWTNKVLYDRINSGAKPYPKYEHRIWFLDGEWKVDSNEITILTAQDSFTGHKYTWFHHPDFKAGDYHRIPCKNHPDGLKEIVCEIPAKAFPDEKSLLQHFARTMKQQDPDIIAGWYLVAADIKTIAQRMEANDLSPKLLSPYNRHNYKYKWTDKRWEQPIPGRICIDQMVAFKKLWVLKNGQLPGQSLDAVAAHCLFDTKLPLADGHDTYYSDLGTYLDYNRKDVDLLPRLDALINCIDFLISMQHLCQCDFQTVALTTGLATCLFRQDPDFHQRIPSEAQFKKQDYTGADIMDVDSGLYGPTAILDIKAMYHSNVNLHNICWTTLEPTGVDCGNGTCFSPITRGLLGRTMDRLTVERDKYKGLMKGAKTPQEAKVWDGMQFATKSLIASLYGVSGDARYGLYHPEIAAAITYTSRATLGKLHKACEDRGYPVIYAHTDSAFVSVPTVEEARELTEKLNVALAPIETEFEKYAESMFMKAKNRYAGKIIWDGEDLEEPDYYIKGIEIIQARMPKVMKVSLKGVLQSMLDGVDEKSITDELCSLIKKYVGEEDVEDLFMKTTLKRNLWDYTTLSGTSAAADWAFTNLNCEIEKGNDILIALNDRGQYIGFPDMTWLPDVKTKTNLGYRVMVERFVVNKARDLYEVVGWNYQNLYNALEGKEDLVWL